jgi:PmbA protein
MSARAPGDVIQRCLERAKRAGADAADAVLVESDAFEARVRGEEIDFVTQARERTLGIRALVGGSGGFRSAITSTSDLSPEAADRMAAETVALARATAEDPDAGIPEEGFAGDRPDLALFDAADRGVRGRPTPASPTPRAPPRAPTSRASPTATRPGSSASTKRLSTRSSRSRLRARTDPCSATTG